MPTSRLIGLDLTKMAGTAQVRCYRSEIFARGCRSMRVRGGLHWWEREGTKN
jgi:hypothetical protein